MCFRPDKAGSQPLITKVIKNFLHFLFHFRFVVLCFYNGKKSWRVGCMAGV